MAQINYREVARQKAMKEAFDELQEFLKTKKGQKALPNWIDLQMYFNEKENVIKKQEDKIKEYRNFFDTLSSLLPRKFSTSDRIG